MRAPFPNKRTLIFLLFAAGCGGTTPAPTSGSRPEPMGELVLLVVLDQMPSWGLKRYLPYLKPDGLVQSAVATGAWVQHTRFEYASTVTAVGHSAIVTGSPPMRSGITTNRTWDRESRATKSTESDIKHSTHGSPEESGSPKALQVATVGDQLKKESPKSKVVTLSLKARAAIFSGGHEADMAIWYTEKGTSPGFTTSTYYAPKKPEWLAQWNRENPAVAYMETWLPENPGVDQLEHIIGEDAGTGEGDWIGLSNTFPHNPSETDQPLKAFAATPQSTTYLLALADKAISHYQMGQDKFPDLMVISVSATDIIGHIFGVESWEYVDNLIRTDHMLGEFVRKLSQQTNLQVLVTSDHGSCPLPERTNGNGKNRLDPQLLVESLNKKAQRKFGRGRWVDAYENPYLYLGPKALHKTRIRKRTAKWLQKELKKEERIHRAYDLKAEPPPNDPIWPIVELSIFPEVGGDFYMVPAPNVIVRKGLKGTTHGTPWLYDRDVPVLAVGSRIKNLTIKEPQQQSSIASTLASLLNISPPRLANPTPLPILSAE